MAKFIYFSLKDRVWGRKSSLRFFKNPLNGYAVYLTERLTKRDQELGNEANNMGIHVTTNNCKPQVWKDCGDGQFMKHTLVDRDDLLKLARTQKLRNFRQKTVDEITPPTEYQTSRERPNVTPANQSGKRPFQEDSPVIDTSLYDKLKAVRGDEGRILDLVESLFNQEKEKKRIISNGSFEQTD